MFIKVTTISILFLLNSYALAESYECTIQKYDAATYTELSSEKKILNFENFRSSCASTSCKRQIHIMGGDEGDPYSISMIAHNAKPPVLAVMIMSFRLDTKPSFEGSSIAGTDYGNRIYSQVNSGNTTIFIECKFQ